MGVCVWAALCVGAVPAEAREGRFVGVTTNTIERMEPFLDEDDVDPLLLRNFGLETGFHSNTWLRWIQPLGGGEVLRFEQQVRYRKFFDREDLDSVFLTPRVQYWKRFDPNWQMRLRADHTWLHRDGETRYHRTRGEAQLRYRDGRRAQTVLRSRFSWYDYNETVLRGFDQTQWRFGLEQYWYPNEDRSYVRGRIFYDVADADIDRASWDELRLGVKGLWAVTETTDLYADAEVRWRDFDGPFNPALPVFGEETRPDLEVGIEQHFGGGLSFVGALGYSENDTNIPTRSFSGLTFQAGFQFRF